MTPHMFRVAGSVCVAISAAIALLTVIGVADHIEKPLPAIIVFALIGAGCIWLASTNRGRRG